MRRDNLRAAVQAITRFDGHIARYVGHEVEAYFEWPEMDDKRSSRNSLNASPAYFFFQT
jgi:hypothetical protein